MSEDTCCVCLETYSETCVPLCLSTGILVCAGCAIRLKPRVCPMTRKHFSEIPRPCPFLLRKMNIDVNASRETFEKITQPTSSDRLEEEDELGMLARHFSRMFNSSSSSRGFREILTEEERQATAFHRLGTEIFRVAEETARSIDLVPLIFYACSSVYIWMALFRSANRPERMSSFRVRFEYMLFHELINPTANLRNGATFRLALLVLLLSSAQPPGGLEVVNRLVAGGCAAELQVLATLLYIAAGIGNLADGLFDFSLNQNQSPRQILSEAWSGIADVAISAGIGSTLCLLFSSDYPFLFTSYLIPLRLLYLSARSIFPPFLGLLTQGIDAILPLLR